MKRRTLTESDVTFSIHCEPEYIPFEVNCSAIDEQVDRETEEWIRDQLDRGNEWVWCDVTVTARWRGFEASDYLGGYSYKSEEDFKQEGGYYQQMKEQALEELNRVVEEAAESVDSLQVR